MAQELFLQSFYTDANLVHYYRFEGNSNDAKGSSNGTDSSITYNSSNGKFGQGAGFDGASSKIVIAANALNFQSYTAWTVASWFKYTSTNTYQSLGNDFTGLNAGHNNASGWYLGTDFGDGTKMAIVSGKNSGHTQGTDWQKAISSTSVNDGNWHQAVGKWDGSSLYIYIDGAFEASNSWGNATADAGTSQFGHVAVDEIDKWYNGASDDFAVFNRSLSATEIGNLYKGSSPTAAFLFNFI